MKSTEFKLDFKESELIQGIHSYDILKNPLYTEAFQYVPVQVPDGFEREDFIIDDDDDDENNCAQSDLVRLLLYLPYMSQ